MNFKNIWLKMFILEIHVKIFKRNVTGVDTPVEQVV